jgi:hypothetical protein
MKLYFKREREKKLKNVKFQHTVHNIFTKSVLSEQTKWCCGVWHSDTPYLRQTFQLIFITTRENPNSTGQNTLNLRKRVCTETFYLSLMLLCTLALNLRQTHYLSLSISLPTIPNPRRVSDKKQECWIRD